MKKTIIAITCILVVFAMLFSFAGCTSAEEEETTTIINVKTPLPTDITTSYDEESNVVTDTTYSAEALAANTATIFEYFNLHINEIKNAKAAVSMSQKKKINKATDENGESIPYCENKYVTAAINALGSYMLHTESGNVEYGESLIEFMPVKGENYVSSLTLDEIESATCVDEGSTRKITVTLKSPSMKETIEKAYDMGNVQDVLDEFTKANKYMTIDTPVITYKNCQIIITSNIETDEVTAIEYIKNIYVAVNVTGHDNISDIGTVPVNFNISNTVKYSLDREEPTTLSAN